MASIPRISFALFIGTGCLLCGQKPSSTSPRQTDLCPEVIVGLIPGLHAYSAASGSPRIEVRRCPSTSLQLVAWKAGAQTPTLIENEARFSLGQVVMNGNVTVATFPGGYDVVQVIRYAGGEPKVAFSESTHAPIAIASAEGRVTVTLSAIPGAKKIVKEFSVEEGELYPSFAYFSSSQLLRLPGGVSRNKKPR